MCTIFKFLKAFDAGDDEGDDNSRIRLLSKTRMQREQEEINTIHVKLFGSDDNNESC